MKNSITHVSWGKLKELNFKRASFEFYTDYLVGSPGFQNVSTLFDQHIPAPSHPHILLLKLEVWNEYQCVKHSWCNCRELRLLGNYLIVCFLQSSNCYWWQWSGIPWEVLHHTPFLYQATCNTIAESNKNAWYTHQHVHMCMCIK